MLHQGLWRQLKILKMAIEWRRRVGRWEVKKKTHQTLELDRAIACGDIIRDVQLCSSLLVSAQRRSKDV